ncbi:RICIN domain-containing protein [Streptomyces syringium]|uniref:RICIN domain-containing protein n=1 Tax=Streptomyces syringium TaxID=76729 RepID=UPI00367CE8FC
MGPKDMIYIKSRFAVCTSLQAEQTWFQDRKPVGISTLTFFVRGSVPKESDRTMRFDYDVVNFFKDGKTGTAGLMYRIEPKFPKVWPSKAQVQNGGSLPVTLSFDELSTRRPTAHFQHTARVAPGQGSGSGKADVVFAVYEPVITSQVPPGWEGKGSSGSPFIMAPRWDSASYLRNSTGEGKPGNRGSATFSYVPTMNYSTAPNAPELGVAKHVEKVFADPNHTLPSAPEGKKIPGQAPDAPLHRLLSENPQYDRNRTVAIQNCKRYYGDDYSDNQTKDCDEFPFASTYEGAAQSEFNPEARRNNFSVLPVISRQNQDAGIILKSFMMSHRIIEGLDDGYLVRVVSEAVEHGILLTNQNSGKCLEIDGSSTNNGARAQQWDCKGQAGAEWQTKSASDDGRYVYLVNGNSGKCLEVADSRKDNGAPAQQWDCADIATQKWELQGSPVNRFIKNVNSGKILVVEGSSKSNGARVQQWDNAGQESNSWRES